MNGSTCSSRARFMQKPLPIQRDRAALLKEASALVARVPAAMGELHSVRLWRDRIREGVNFRAAAARRALPGRPGEPATTATLPLERTAWLLEDSSARIRATSRRASSSRSSTRASRRTPAPCRPRKGWCTLSRATRSSPAPHGETWRVSQSHFRSKYRPVPPVEDGEAGAYQSLPQSHPCTADARAF